MAAGENASGAGRDDAAGASTAAGGLTPEETIADRYVVKRRLGAGGMGEAWLAEDTMLRRKLVLKRLKGTDPAGPGETAQAARAGHLLTEAKRATAINSPHIAQVYDLCRHRGEWLLAMEYVAGHDLRAEIATPLSVERYFALAVQIAEALEAAHAAGILHCDIKPENILVTEQGFVKVLDFGLARMMASPDGTNETVSLAGAGHAFAGTPGYMAPEVLREADPTEQSDIFALGVVLYEMAGGTAPFRGKTLADSVQKTLAAEPAALDLKSRGLPAGLARILQKALMKQPERRYATVRDLLVDLRDCASGGTASRGAAGKRPFALVVTAAVTIVAVAAILSLTQRHFQRHAAPPSPTAVAAAKTRLLAVLPFQVIGSGSDRAAMSAYSEGLREAITSSLARVAPADRIDVLAASEVRAHGLTTPEEAHKELGADLVIDGSYQQFHNQVRILYELVGAGGKVSGQPGEVKSTPDDPFKLEDDVVAGVLQMLSLSARPEESAPQRTTVPAAYDAYLRGVGYLRDYDIADNLKKAEASFTEATHADPKFASAYAGLGEAHWAQYLASNNEGEIALARRGCEKAVQLNAQVAEAQICQGTIDDGTGQAKQAQGEFQEALRLDPQSDTALNGLARTDEELEQPQEAEKVYREAIQARPYYWANYYALANFLLRRAEYAQAATVLEDGVAKFPANSFLARRLGVVYFLEGQFDPAAAAFQKAIGEHPHAEAYMDLGQVYLHQGQFAPAVAALEKAAALKPNSFSVEADLADAYAWSGNAAKAAAHYREAVALSQARLQVNPQDLNALMVAAYGSAALGEKQAALKYLDAALRHAPEDAEVNYYAARVYVRNGDAATARMWAEKALAHGYSKADIGSAPDLKSLVPGAPTR
ncbi:MAG TPA: protein kinase [Acidobacteriaceae bacterium]|nr:protein kinase [Acidobacteriaceae bacterium]